MLSARGPKPAACAMICLGLVGALAVIPSWSDASAAAALILGGGLFLTAWGAILVFVGDRMLASSGVIARPKGGVAFNAPALAISLGFGIVGVAFIRRSETSLYFAAAALFLGTAAFVLWLFMYGQAARRRS
jgi:hypothetical protein